MLLLKIDNNLEVFNFSQHNIIFLKHTKRKIEERQFREKYFLSLTYDARNINWTKQYLFAPNHLFYNIFRNWCVSHVQIIEFYFFHAGWLQGICISEKRGEREKKRRTKKKSSRHKKQRETFLFLLSLVVLQQQTTAKTEQKKCTNLKTHTYLLTCFLNHILPRLYP